MAGRTGGVTMSDGYGVPPDAWNTGSTEPNAPGPVYPDDPTVSLPPWKDDATQTGFIPGAWQVAPPGPPRPPRHSQSLVALWVALAVLVLVGGGIGIYAVAHHSSSTHQDANRGNGASGSESPVGVLNGGGAATGAQTGVATPSAAPVSDSVSASSGGASPAGDSGVTVAAKVDNVLDQSVAVRADVQPALNRIAACRADESDISALQNAADVRRNLSTKISAVSFDRVANGSALKAALTRLLTTSAEADDAYVQWGTHQLGCSGHASNDAAKKRGDRYSEQATSFKTSFLRLWNPVAEQYGLPTRKQADI